MSKKKKEKKEIFLYPTREEKIHTSVEDAMKDLKSSGERNFQKYGAPSRTYVIDIGDLMDLIRMLSTRVDVCEKTSSPPCAACPPERHNPLQGASPFCGPLAHTQAGAPPLHSREKQEQVPAPTRKC